MTPRPPVSATPNAGSIGVAPSPVIARYDGVLSLSMERSAFTIVDERRAARNRLRFTSSPDFSATPALGPNAGIEQLLKARLVAVLEFGSDLPANSHADLVAAIDQRWQGVAQARHARDRGETADAYERVRVEGVIRADGTAEWGYTFGSEGVALPVQNRSASGSNSVAPRSEFERYIQNQMRADLLGS
jgi:hypothetical protein